MKETLITFETAKLAQEKGFDLKTLYYYIFKERKNKISIYELEGEKRILRDISKYIIEDYNDNSNCPEDMFRNGFVKSGCTYFNLIAYLKDICPVAKIFAPTQSFLQKWLREVHNINIEPRNSSAFNPTTRVFTPRKEYKCFVNFMNKTYEDFIETKYFSSYEEALEIGLQKALKLIL